MKPRLDCVHFLGYKPCGQNSSCDLNCQQFQKRGKQILLIHLGALGAVVRSTALISSIHRKYPNSQITWVTQNPAQHLLKNHPQLHRVLTVSETDLLALSVLSFDVAFVIDKSLEASGVLKRTTAQEVYGYKANSFGVIEAVNQSAEELWHIGLSDHLKLKVNKKTELELLRTALELDNQNDDYNLPLTMSEKDIQYQRYSDWSLGGQKKVIGINTGCANVIKAKKLSVENHRELIRMLQKNSNYTIVLLGGPEDTLRNNQIADGMRGIIQSETEKGLRDGLVSIAACDAVITGDSLGMHMAISQKKQVIAWFGPTCSHEIELYGRGQKIISQAACGPCWKRSCHKPVMCYDLVNLDEIISALKQQSKNQSESRDSNGLFGRSVARGAAFDLDEEALSGATLRIDLS